MSALETLATVIAPTGVAEASELEASEYETVPSEGALGAETDMVKSLIFRALGTAALA